MSQSFAVVASSSWKGCLLIEMAVPKARKDMIVVRSFIVCMAVEFVERF